MVKTKQKRVLSYRFRFVLFFLFFTTGIVYLECCCLIKIKKSNKWLLTTHYIYKWMYNALQEA